MIRIKFLFEKDEMITQEATTKFTIITVCKYDEYNASQPTSEQPQTNEQPTVNQPPAISEEGKEVKKVNKEEIGMLFSEYLGRFNTIRGTRYRGTDQTMSKFAKTIKTHSVDEMISALVSAMNVKNHVDSDFKWLTPEFFTRPDKIELYRTEDNLTTSTTTQEYTLEYNGKKLPPMPKWCKDIGEWYAYNYEFHNQGSAAL